MVRTEAHKGSAERLKIVKFTCRRVYVPFASSASFTLADFNSSAYLALWVEVCPRSDEESETAHLAFRTGPHGGCPAVLQRYETDAHTHKGTMHPQARKYRQEIMALISVDK